MAETHTYTKKPTVSEDRKRNVRVKTIYYAVKKNQMNITSKNVPH